MSRNKDQNLEAAPVPFVSATTKSPLRVLRCKEVCKITGLGRSSIYRLQSEGHFPHSIKIGVRAVGWLEDEVRNWLVDRIADSRGN